MLEQAFRLHAQGRFTEAERAYQDAIRLDPGNVQALHLLGVLRLQRGETGPAIALMCRSLAIEPRQALAQRDLGNAYQQAGRPDDALSSYDRALALKPEMADAHNNRGICLAALGRTGEAVTAYGRAIALKPDYAQAYNNRGTALSSLRRLSEAVADFDNAVALKADYIKAYNNRGAALVDLNRLADALADHDRAISLAPEEVDSHVKRAGVLVRLGRQGEALESYDRAVALDPHSADAHDGRATTLTLLQRPVEALESAAAALALNPSSSAFHNNRGSALAALGRADEALQSFAKALSLDPHSATALSNRATCLSMTGRAQEGLASLDRALELMPNLTQGHINRGNILSDLKRYDDALASFERALCLSPDSADGHFGRATTLLRQGRFAEGWPPYEWRKKRVSADAFHAQGRPEWTGRERLEGKIVFVEAEQGLGDCIQFCRYVPLLADLGARVTMTVRGGQKRLLRSLDPRVEILDAGTLPSAFDYHMALLSLPLAFETRVVNIPARTPYLRASPERSEYWRQRLGGRGLKVGIAWQGSAYSASRSFPLSDAIALASVPHVRLISLQKDAGLEQLSALPSGMTVEGPGADYLGGDFAETAAIIDALDLVISCDTAMLHLAGAMKRPVWAALAHAADWRWLQDGNETPWYPGMRLFRQAGRGEWRGVFEAMRRELERFDHFAPRR
ncbi:MAG: tetratricopeptide repeat protein [Rhizomicrobium sp.]